MDVNEGLVKAHAKFSASGSKRWMECPGSIHLSECAPPSRDSVWSVEGTRAHSALEILLKNRQKFPQAVAWVRKKYPPAMADIVVIAAQEIIEEFKDADEFLCETRVRADPFTTKGQFGTVDAAAVYRFRRLKVLDYKHGAGVLVEVENNSQLIYYALGLFLKYYGLFDDIEIIVQQPRANHPSGKTTRRVTYSADELRSWGYKFKAAVKRIESGDRSLKYGKEWCQFCPAKGVCSEFKSNSKGEGRRDFLPRVDSTSLLSDLD